MGGFWRLRRLGGVYVYTSLLSAGMARGVDGVIIHGAPHCALFTRAQVVHGKRQGKEWSVELLLKKISTRLLLNGNR